MQPPAQTVYHQPSVGQEAINILLLIDLPGCIDIPQAAICQVFSHGTSWCQRTWLGSPSPRKGEADPKPSLAHSDGLYHFCT